MRHLDFYFHKACESPPDFGDASPKNTNWAGAPTSDYRKLQIIFF